MIPIIAQGSAAPTSAGAWVAASGVVTIILAQLGKWISDFNKDRRDARMEMQKQAILYRIADLNDRALVAQGEVKQALVSSQEIDRMRYEALIDTIDGSCKYRSQDSKKTQ